MSIQANGVMILKLKHLLDQPFIRKAAVQLQHKFIASPYDCDDMEFKYGVWAGISSFQCEKGRQLGEQNTMPGRLREVVATEYTQCKFPGCRHGGQMNVTALRNMMLSWDDALALAMAIRTLFVETYSNKEHFTGEALTVLELYLVARLAIAYTAYKIRRKIEPVLSGKLSSHNAALYQLIAGVFLIGEHMLTEAAIDLDQSTSMTAEELFNYADQNGIFVSDTGGVCAGSKKNIVKFLDCLIHGSTEYQTSLADNLIKGADVNKAIFLDYYENTVALELSFGRIAQRLQLDQQRYCYRLAESGHDRLAHDMESVFCNPPQPNLFLDPKRSEKKQRRIITTDLILHHYLRTPTPSIYSSHTAEYPSTTGAPFHIRKLNDTCTAQVRSLMHPLFTEYTKALVHAQCLATTLQNNILATLDRPRSLILPFDQISTHFNLLSKQQLAAHFGLELIYLDTAYFQNFRASA